MFKLCNPNNYNNYLIIKFYKHQDIVYYFLRYLYIQCECWSSDSMIHRTTLILILQYKCICCVQRMITDNSKNIF